MANAAAAKATYGNLMSRLGFSSSGEGAHVVLSGPFQPIASIVAHCEEKTGALMGMDREHA